MQKEKLKLLSVKLGWSILLLFVALLLFTSPKYINGIYVDELIIIHSYKYYNIDYCKLLRKAVKGDVNSIKKIALLEFKGFANFPNGQILIHLIEIIGEDKIICPLETISEEQKHNIWVNIRGGKQFILSYQGKTAEEAFPKIYTFTHQR